MSPLERLERGFEIAKPYAAAMELLQKAILHPKDLEFAQRLLLSMGPGDEKPLASLALLLTQTEKTKRLVLQRERALKVDLTKTLSRYSHDQLVNSARAMSFQQLTVGCTGGCPWCGVMAERRVTSQASFESIVAYNAQYAEYFPENVRIAHYLASDPFDWMDGERTYVELADSLNRLPTYQQSEAGLYVSTHIPEGTEISILRFIKWLWAMDKAGQKNATLLRFSRDKTNEDRVKAICKLAVYDGVPWEFIYQHVLFEDIDAPIKQGTFINHPDRDVIVDAVGISCVDGVMLHPTKGIILKTLEVVTHQSPEGWATQILNPQAPEYTIPQFIHIDSYSYPLNKDVSDPAGFRLFSLLPPVNELVYQDGKSTNTSQQASLRREALAFALCFGNLSYLDFWYLGKDHPNKPTHLPPPTKANRERIYNDLCNKVLPELMARTANYQKLRESESDMEAVEIADFFLEGIVLWYKQARVRLGLTNRLHEVSFRLSERMISALNK